MSREETAGPAKPDPLLLGLGRAVRRLRFEHEEISQERLGQDSGVHRNYIGGIERGERMPTLLSVAKIAGAFEIRPSQLLTMAEREAERHGASWPPIDDEPSEA